MMKVRVSVVGMMKKASIDLLGYFLYRICTLFNYHVDTLDEFKSVVIVEINM